MLAEDSGFNRQAALSRTKWNSPPRGGGELAVSLSPGGFLDLLLLSVIGGRRAERRRRTG
jgi:hypothetical protein